MSFILDLFGAWRSPGLFGYVLTWLWKALQRLRVSGAWAGFGLGGSAGLGVKLKP